MNISPKQAQNTAYPDEVLLVSKPVQPPWNDSSKNLVRDLSSGLSRYRPTVMARRSANPVGENVDTAFIYADRTSGFSPSLGDRVAVLRYLLSAKAPPIWHFFFAPNKKTAIAAKIVSKLRSAATVQTVCSAPAQGVDLNSALFADINVVLSQHTFDRFIAEGVPEHRLRRVLPCLRLPTPRSDQDIAATKSRYDVRDGEALIVYPGDLEFGGGAELCIRMLHRMRGRRAKMIFACRVKTPAALRTRQALQALLNLPDGHPRVDWVGEVDDILDLIAAADVVLLPAASLYAKMDYPLVVLEAMALRRAVVITDGTPAAELASGGCVLSVPFDASALEGKLNELLDQSRMRAEVGETAYGWVQEHCSPEAIGAQYESIYDELLTSTRT